MKVDILGTTYEIIQSTESEDPILRGSDGYCDHTIKAIVHSDFIPDEDSLKDLDAYKNKVIRHEIIHAFLNESGLQCNSDWARNEEMIDYFAIQLPKMVKAMNSINIL